MKYRIPPKIAIINSFAGYGRCSTTEALPIVSAMGVQGCPVPTSIFSNHTGFSSHYCLDFTASMESYLAQWDSLGVVFDGIYCGFLGQRAQIPIVADFIRKQKEKGCSMILIDPVMGDHGKPYRTLTMEHCQALSELVIHADIITPNITEACILTGTPFKEKGWQPDELEALAEKLHAFGPEKIAVTGLLHEDAAGQTDGFINYISQRTLGCANGIAPDRIASDRAADTPPCRTASDRAADTAPCRIASCSFLAPVTGPSRHGTGDIFASILAADAVLGRDFTESVKKAAAFIGDCIRVSEELHIPECDGVCFENFLGQLI